MPATKSNLPTSGSSTISNSSGLTEVISTYSRATTSANRLRWLLRRDPPRTEKSHLWEHGSFSVPWDCLIIQETSSICGGGSSSGSSDNPNVRCIFSIWGRERESWWDRRFWSCRPVPSNEPRASSCRLLGTNPPSRRRRLCGDCWRPGVDPNAPRSIATKDSTTKFEFSSRERRSIDLVATTSSCFKAISSTSTCRPLLIYMLRPFASRII
mmetsp:Transcript_22298/g.53032  ORF Transcript_22298/g.53032 Transcript_22298/m.53032 type:complete len:212 (-) Transcript_22298:576-1211(-)